MSIEKLQRPVGVRFYRAQMRYLRRKARMMRGNLPRVLRRLVDEAIKEEEKSRKRKRGA